MVMERITSAGNSNQKGGREKLRNWPWSFLNYFLTFSYHKIGHSLIPNNWAITQFTQEQLNG
jgi:hypothetical protein